MAVLHHKEQKIQVVIGRLPKKYTAEQFVEMFIKLYSKDWGKIKAAYIKQSQDKAPGTVVNMPKPDLYLQQLLSSYLQQPTAPAIVETVKKPEDTILPAKTEKAAANKKVLPTEETPTVAKKEKVPAKKKIVPTEETPAAAAPIKVKAPAKKKTVSAEETPTVAKKEKAPAKKKVVVEEAKEIAKKPKAATKKKEN